VRITRGRVLRGEATRNALPVLPLVTAERRQRILRDEAGARMAAEVILENAREEARVIVAEARAAAEDARSLAAREAREEEHAKLAALYLALRSEDERRAERDLDRAVSLAVVLAERLLGEALEHNPQHIAGLARQALGEARGAKKARVDAHPLDAEALKSHLDSVGMSPDAIEVRAAADLGRGSLRVHTNLGTLDAKLTPQLERLAAALRDALKA
jgi:flagellar biosynthesis/type III secretory pathway protein FliH